MKTETDDFFAKSELAPWQLMALQRNSAAKLTFISGFTTNYYIKTFFLELYNIVGISESTIEVVAHYNGTQALTASKFESQTENFVERTVPYISG